MLYLYYKSNQNHLTMKKYKLSVVFTQLTDLSFQLACYCKTQGKPANIEKAYTVKRVNYYKFKDYVTSSLNVANFGEWYAENRGTVNFNDVLTNYINTTENRTAIYSTPTYIDRLLDEAIRVTRHNNNMLRKALQTA